MLRNALPLGALALVLSACQTTPKETVLNLDTTDPRWMSDACIAARQAVHRYDDKGRARIAAGVAGTAAGGPVVGAAANVALSATQDDEREDLNNAVKRACVSKPGDAPLVATTTDDGDDPPPLDIPPPDAGQAGGPASATEPEMAEPDPPEIPATPETPEPE